MTEYERRTTYTPEIHAMTAPEIWQAWKRQEISVDQLATWQERHGYYFNETGGQILARRLFHRLERGYYSSEYLVLNDGRYLARIWADSDAEAVRIFEAGAYQKGAAV